MQMNRCDSSNHRQLLVTTLKDAVLCGTVVPTITVDLCIVLKADVVVASWLLLCGMVVDFTVTRSQS